jgi:hypothetical protein
VGFKRASKPFKHVENVAAQLVAPFLSKVHDKYCQVAISYHHFLARYSVILTWHLLIRFRLVGEFY